MRRFFGIPIPILAVILVIVLVGGGVSAAFFFTRSQPATVTIKGGGVDVFQDSACTIPLGDTVTLDFGEVREESPSGTVTFYVRNIGTDNLYPVASTDINSNLILIEATYGEIGSSPVNLYTPQSYTFVPGGTTGTLAAAMDASQTTFSLTTGVSPGTYPTYAKIENEILQVTAYNPGTYTFTCQRAWGGSTAAAHATGLTVTFGALNETAGDVLEPAEVQAIALHIEVGGDISAYLGDSEAFNVDIDVSSDF